MIKLALMGLENVYGAGLAAVTENDGVPVFDTSVNVLQNEPVVDMKNKGFPGSDLSFVANPDSRYTGSMYIRGGGTGDAPIPAGLFKILRACGMAQTTVAGQAIYKPTISSAVEDSLCIAEFMHDNKAADGLKHIITGARGTVNFTFNSGELPLVSFEFLGGYKKPTGGEAIIRESFNAAVWKRASRLSQEGNYRLDIVLPNGQTIPNLEFRTLEVNLNNQVQAVHVVADSQKQQVDVHAERQGVSGRFIALQFTPNTFDVWKQATDGGWCGILLRCGTAAGDVWSLSLPKVQFQSPTHGEANGRYTVEGDLNILPTSGGDEMTLTFYSADRAAVDALLAVPPVTAAAVAVAAGNVLSFTGAAGVAIPAALGDWIDSGTAWGGASADLDVAGVAARGDLLVGATVIGGKRISKITSEGVNVPFVQTDKVYGALVVQVIRIAAADKYNGKTLVLSL